MTFEGSKVLEVIPVKNIATLIILLSRLFSLI